VLAKKYPDFKNKVKEIWNEPYHTKSAFDRIQSKLKKFKQYFKGWEFNRQGDRKKQKMEIQNELWKLELVEEENPLYQDQMIERVNITGELMKILEEEELYWYKRAHEKWLYEGDGNTEFFHRVANGRKRKNTIFS
jgi:hypothetical protein